MSRSRLAVSFGPQLDLDILTGEEAPPTADALLVAQDVYLVMGETDVVEDPGPLELPELLVSSSRPHALGTLVVSPGRQGIPLLIQAVVHDFDRSPHVREEHVFQALVAAFEEMKLRGLERLAVHPLGTSHSGMLPARFLGLLLQVCYSSAELGTSLRRVHLLLPTVDEMDRYEGLLRQVFGPPAA